MSTGLEYIPDRYSKTEEVIALTKVVGEFGGIYTSHMRDEAAVICDAVRETVRIAEETGVRANIAHFKVCGKNNWGLMKQAIALIRDAGPAGSMLSPISIPIPNPLRLARSGRFPSSRTTSNPWRKSGKRPKTFIIRSAPRRSLKRRRAVLGRASQGAGR